MYKSVSFSSSDFLFVTQFFANEFLGSILKNASENRFMKGVFEVVLSSPQQILAVLQLPELASLMHLNTDNGSELGRAYFEAMRDKVSHVFFFYDQEKSCFAGISLFGQVSSSGKSGLSYLYQYVAAPYRKKNLYSLMNKKFGIAKLKYMINSN